MELLRKSKFIEIFFDEAKSLLINRWLEASKDFTDEEFCSEMLAYGNCLRQKTPRHNLINLQDYLFPIAPEIQEWIDEKINSIGLQIGIEKVAILVPRDSLTCFSVEQTMAGEAGKKLPLRYFQDKEKAMNWLK